jgi:uncharacterized protein
MRAGSLIVGDIPDAMLLRIFIGENDRHHGKPLYEAIVMTARQMQLAGAMVLRGAMSFGKSSRLHSARIQRLSGGPTDGGPTDGG